MKNKSKTKLLKRLFIFFLICGAVGAIAILGINKYVISKVQDRIITQEKAYGLKADCILVLGAGVLKNGAPSAMLEDRMRQGIELYKSGASDRLLVSGDHGRVEYDEVNVMKAFAMKSDIPSENVFMDHAGFSTYESIYRARDIFKAKKIIIVTQKYHLYRALYIAEKLGFDAYGVPSDPRRYANPRSRNIREYAARVKDFFYVIYKPEPTYLGKEIPVSGNGNLTNDKK